MGLINSLSIAVLIGNLGLGILVFLGDRKKQANKAYFLITISLAAWIAGLVLMSLSPTHFWRLFGFKVIFIAPSFLSFCFFYFCYFFPRKTFFIPKAFHLFSLATLIGMLVASLCGNLITKDIGADMSGEVWTQYGPLYPLWAIAFLLYFMTGLLILTRKHRKARGIERLQIKYLLIGTTISMAIAVTTNLLLPLFGASFSLRQFGPLALIFSIVSTTYGITKHHLMNLKIITTELLVGMVLILLLVEVLTAQSFLTILFNLLVLVVFGYLGISLIRSVLREIERSAELEKAYKKLKKIDKAKSEFIAMASHQLRTPLTIVKGLSSMLLENIYGELDKKKKEPLEDIFNSNERLINLVNDLLNISRVDLGKMELTIEKIDIADMITDITRTLRPRAEAKGLKLEWESPAQPVLVEADSIKIRQIVLNIIDNAVKYTVKGKIEVIVKDLGAKVRIIVKDTGEGLTKEEKEEIFESFTRGAAGLRFSIQGTGLGLYLAKKYVELHGGKIWAESKGEAKGSSFYVELSKKKNAVLIRHMNNGNNSG